MASALVTRWPAAGLCETTVLESVMGAMGATGFTGAGRPKDPGAVGDAIGAIGRTPTGTTSILAICSPMDETREDAAESVRPIRFGMT